MPVCDSRRAGLRRRRWVCVAELHDIGLRLFALLRGAGRCTALPGARSQRVAYPTAG